MTASHPSRAQFLDGLPPDIGDAVARIAAVAATIARRIARGGLDEDLTAAVGTNTDGDGQKALDVIADAAFRDALAGSSVRWLASEEQPQAVPLSGTGSLALAIDPLDGSSNIETNVSIGTIFGLYPAEDTAEASFLRPGRDLLAAGYVIYGPQCMLVLAHDGALRCAVLDAASGGFVPRPAPAPIPAGRDEYAINASNYRHWQAPIRAYVDDMVAGCDGPRGRNFNMRWIASLVAEVHRIVIRGGVFLYPADDREGYGEGRLRLLYEAAPVALVIEAAGGAATDGSERILDKVPTGLHARTPLVFGAHDKVDRVATYHDLPGTETSALFARRGLFRV